MKIKLLQDHTHAGTRYLAGELLDVLPDAAAWLLTQGVGADPLIGAPLIGVRPQLKELKKELKDADLPISTDSKEIK